MEKERTYRLEDWMLNRLGVQVDFRTGEHELLRKLNHAFFSVRTVLSGSATIKLTDREVDILKNLTEEDLRQEQSMSGKGQLTRTLRALNR